MKKYILFLLCIVYLQITLAQNSITGSKTYYGITPCGDCPGIETVITLYGNNTFRMQLVYLERNQGKAFITNGSYQKKQDEILLYANNQLVRRVKQGSNQLQLLDQDGKAITGNLAESFLLQEKKIRSRSGWKSAYQKGVDVLGVGTEPFWSLELDREGLIQFNTPEQEKPIRFAYLPPKQQAGEAVYLLYNGTDSGKLTIRQQISSDGMSDELYPNQVLLNINHQSYKGVGIVLNESTPLTGTWELQYLNKPKATIPSLFASKIPKLVIDGGRSRFTGSNGCNMISGSFRTNRDSMRFDGDMTSTMMACMGDGEQWFNRYLRETNRYTVSQKALIFYQGNRILMRFRKIK